MTAKDTTYNGWKNYQTWNVALWIANDEGLYRDAVEFMRKDARARGRSPYRAFIGHMRDADALGETTTDGVAWLDSRLDYKALNAFMRELG